MLSCLGSRACTAASAAEATIFYLYVVTAEVCEWGVWWAQQPPSLCVLTCAVHVLGFHGDVAELTLVNRLLDPSSPCAVTAFVETGTYYSATFQYVLRSYPHLAAYITAEVAPDRFRESVSLSRSVRSLVVNATGTGSAAPPYIGIFNGDSAQLLETLAKDASVTAMRTLFWLDAHHGSDPASWPLPAEVGHAMHHWCSGFVFVDDFVVPDKPQYGFDEPYYNFTVWYTCVLSRPDPTAAVSV